MTINYELLPSVPPPDYEGNSGEKGDLELKLGFWDRWSSFMLYAFTLFTTSLAVAAMLAEDTPAGSQLTRPAPRVLRRPSPYVNQDRLRRLMEEHNANFRPVDNFAVSVFQINVGDAKRVLHEDYSRHETTEIGVIWPEDRHFLVTRETSTIMQFRNRDFAMENCVLHISIPVQSPVFDPSPVISRSQVDVWALVDSPELRPTISWNRGPGRDYLLTSVWIDMNTNFTSKAFHCPSGRFTTMEFSCSNNENPCLVDFWQDQQSVPYNGVHIVQHQS